MKLWDMKFEIEGHIARPYISRYKVHRNMSEVSICREKMAIKSRTGHRALCPMLFCRVCLCGQFLWNYFWKRWFLISRLYDLLGIRVLWSFWNSSSLYLCLSATLGTFPSLSTHAHTHTHTHTSFLNWGFQKKYIQLTYVE